MIAAISGVMMFPTSEATTAPNAVPITTATAKSTRFPRSRNCLNSLNIRAPLLVGRSEISNLVRRGRSTASFNILVLHEKVNRQLDRPLDEQGVRHQRRDPLVVAGARRATRDRAGPGGQHLHDTGAGVGHVRGESIEQHVQ